MFPELNDAGVSGTVMRASGCRYKTVARRVAGRVARRADPVGGPMY